MAYENNECITKGHKSVWKCLVDMKDTEIEGRASYQNKGGKSAIRIHTSTLH